MPCKLSLLVHTWTVYMYTIFQSKPSAEINSVLYSFFWKYLHSLNDNENVHLDRQTCKSQCPLKNICQIISEFCLIFPESIADLSMFNFRLVRKFHISLKTLNQFKNNKAKGKNWNTTCTPIYNIIFVITMYNYQIMI